MYLMGRLDSCGIFVLNVGGALGSSQCILILHRLVRHVLRRD